MKQTFKKCAGRRKAHKFCATNCRNRGIKRTLLLNALFKIIGKRRPFLPPADL
ncbi:zinc-finger domain-containing protein [Massilia horti]|uniref:Uncharacterized protein n=1 Tax=Massilia horti TaxID=2562153 RepID=A0A4Y9SZ76_9BURK|nr:hypothetical protein E4O92_11530 [Massilia horti]